MSNEDRNILDSGFKLSPLIKQVLAESQATETDDLAGEVFDRIARHDRDMALFQALRSLVRESWRPAFIPSQQTVRSEQRSQVEQTVAPERDGRQWLTATGGLIDTPEEKAAAEEDAEANAVESEAAQMFADEVSAGVPAETAEKRVREVVQSTWERQEQRPVERPAPPAPPARLTPIRSQRPIAPPPRPQQSPKVAAIREAWRKALRQRIATGQGVHKFLADCTIVDLEHAADLRESHAKRVQARADQLRTLAGLMRDHDAKTLSDVPATVLAAMSETLTEAAAA